MAMLLGASEHDRPTATRPSKGQWVGLMLAKECSQSILLLGLHQKPQGAVPAAPVSLPPPPNAVPTKPTQSVQHVGSVQGDAKVELKRQLGMLVKKQQHGKAGRVTWQCPWGSSFRCNPLILLTGSKSALDGIYTLFSDMGGQPQFWALVAAFLRKSVVCETIVLGLPHCCQCV